jgi:hypothetical protein
LVEIDGLYDIRIRTEFVPANEIILLAGRREDDDGEHAQSGVGANLSEGLQAVHSRHFQVEQNDGGGDRRTGAEGVPALEKIQDLRAVVYYDYFIRQIKAVQRRERELDIVRIIFRE